VKVAVAVFMALIAKVQEPVPVHAPPHPLKVQPDIGAALRVTLVPLLYVCVQLLPQLIYPSLLVTEPLPVVEMFRE
jgi:hypothetical protein